MDKAKHDFLPRQLTTGIPPRFDKISPCEMPSRVGREGRVEAQRQERKVKRYALLVHRTLIRDVRCCGKVRRWKRVMNRPKRKGAELLCIIALPRSDTTFKHNPWPYASRIIGNDVRVALQLCSFCPSHRIIPSSPALACMDDAMIHVSSTLLSSA